MSQFNLENAISDATRHDAPVQRGPMMRWQRKALESGVRSVSLECKDHAGLFLNNDILN